MKEQLISLKSQLKKHLDFIYHDYDEVHLDTILELVSEYDSIFKQRDNLRTNYFSEKDSVLITYPDQVQEKGKTPLKSLFDFCDDHLSKEISIVHILPFYPWTTDDGFSVIDYNEVEKSYGSWQDIQDAPFPVMADAVFNHCSSENPIFQAALEGDREAESFFVTYPENSLDSEEFKNNIANVVRPRVHDLLTPYKFKRENGHETRLVWTTFSPDQVDTNYANISFLIYSIKCLLDYYKHGIYWVRIDAIPFYWKELGTNCSHHPKTHEIVKLYRTISDYFEQNFVIMTESNVPHHENITYWGNGTDEAQVIYNFTLPSLLVHGYIYKDAKKLHNWSDSITLENDQTTMFNINATHDGIGVRGMEGHVDDIEIDFIAEYILSKGGRINYKTSRKKGKRPYELNITWTSLLYDDELDIETNYRKILASHLVTYAFPGVPGIYFHNLVASENWEEGVEHSGINRRINRQKFDRQQVEDKIEKDEFKSQIFKGLKAALQVRKEQKAFHPSARKEDFSLHDQVWSFKRGSDADEITVFCSLSNETINLDYPGEWGDILSTNTYSNTIELKPYEIIWLKQK